MLPRPILTSTFGLAYRKIPVLALGRDLYCDTSLIIEALEHFFPASAGYGTVYPKFEGVDEWTYKGLVRGFASFWTDVSDIPFPLEWNGRREGMDVSVDLTYRNPCFGPQQA
jgi:glutathione S-transferase